MGMPGGRGRGGLGDRQGTYVANGDVLLAGLLEDLGDDALLLELKVHLGLVRLDLHEHLAGLDGVAGLLVPRADVARRHGRREGRHLDDGVRGERGVAPEHLRRDAVAQGPRLERPPPEDDADHGGRTERVARWPSCGVVSVRADDAGSGGDQAPGELERASKKVRALGGSKKT